MMNKTLFQLVFGKSFFPVLESMQKSQYLPLEGIRELQAKKLIAMLKFAHARVPYYQTQNINAYDILEFDVLKKTTLNNNYIRFFADGWHLFLMHRTSSGSTNNPIKVYLDRETYGKYLAGFYRGLSWHGVSLGERGIHMLGTTSHSFLRAATLIKDACMNIKKAFARTLDDASFHSLLQVIQANKPAYLYGYPSFIYQLAKRIKSLKVPVLLPPLKVVATTGELLYDFQRALIEEVFSCKAASEYGCSELGSIAFECPHGSLHVTAENVFVEFLDKALIATQLNNYVMPLIRYRNGDIGKYASGQCTCGRSLPVMNIFGRASDALFVDNECLYIKDIYNTLYEQYYRSAVFPEFKILQTGPSTLKVFYAGALGALKNQLQECIGHSVHIEAEPTGLIPQQESGKIRYFEKSEAFSENTVCH